MYSSDRPFQRAIVHPKKIFYSQVTPPGSWYTKLPKKGSTKLFGFHLKGLGFWILFMLKIILKPNFNPSSYECEYPSHLFSKISCHHSSESFTLYFYSLCTFLSIIEIVYYYIFLFMVASLIHLCYIIAYLRYLCTLFYYISSLILYRK